MLDIGDERIRRAVVEYVADLVGREAGVDRDRDRAELGRGEDHFDVGRAIAENQGDAIATGDSHRGQRRGTALNPCVEFGVAEAAVGVG